MTAIRYRVDQVPSWGMGAFAPVPAMTGTAATAGTERRNLQQWTQAPDPALQAFSVPCYDAAAQGSYANPNGVTGFVAGGAPGAFLPPQVPSARHFMQYWTEPGPWMGPNGRDVHMKIYSDNPVPVPAVNVGRAAMPAMKQPPWGTIVSTAWPRPFVSWPTWGTSRSQ